MRQSGTAVLRGDFGAILVEAGANVQDGSVLHGEVVIGAGATIGHLCIVHSAIDIARRHAATTHQVD